MNKEFIPYEERQSLNEIWELYDEPCFGYYSHPDNKPCGGNYPCYGENNAPLYQQAFKWFRKKYNLHSFVNELWKSTELVGYYFSAGTEHYSYNNPHKTYEEAELACLRKLIEIVKEQQR